MLGIAGGLTAATVLAIGRLVADERERGSQREPMLAGDARWRAMTLNERDYYGRELRRRDAASERTPPPSQVLDAGQLVALVGLRAKVRAGRYGDDQVAGLDLRYAQWGRYLVDRGIVSDKQAQAGGEDDARQEEAAAE